MTKQCPIKFRLGFLCFFPYVEHTWSSWIHYSVPHEERIPNLFKQGEDYVRVWHSERERRICLICGETQDQKYHIEGIQ